MKGLFITFEGIEGCGKSTQIALLREYLETRGYGVTVTREPGGTPIAEAIRAILLDPSHGAMGAVAEVLLYEAARAQLTHEVIGPALSAGRIVLCDRFADSTTAYQGAGRGLEIEQLYPLHRLATQGVWPDCTILLDVPVEVGLARVQNRGLSDRIEQEARAFHQRVRDGFLRLAKEEPDRITIIEGERPAGEVAAAIRNRMDSILAQNRNRLETHTT
jgi:dTMP kinase